MRHPVARRFWYQNSARYSRPLLMAPSLVTMTFVVAVLGGVLHLAVWFNACTCNEFFHERNEAGVSLGAVIHTANVLMLVYLLTCLALSLFPETLAPRYERFQVALCAVVLATCVFTFALV